MVINVKRWMFVAFSDVLYSVTSLTLIDMKLIVRPGNRCQCDSQQRMTINICIKIWCCMTKFSNLYCPSSIHSPLTSILNFQIFNLLHQNLKLFFPVLTSIKFPSLNEFRSQHPQHFLVLLVSV